MLVFAHYQCSANELSYGVSATLKPLNRTQKIFSAVERRTSDRENLFHDGGRFHAKAKYEPLVLGGHAWLAVIRLMIACTAVSSST